MEVWIPLLGFGYNSDTDKTFLCHNRNFGQRLVSSALTIYKLDSPQIINSTEYRLFSAILSDNIS